MRTIQLVELGPGEKRNGRIGGGKKTKLIFKT